MNSHALHSLTVGILLSTVSPTPAATFRGDVKVGGYGGRGGIVLGPIAFTSSYDNPFGVAKIPTTIDFVRTSRDGRRWIMDLRYEAKAFAKMTATGQTSLTMRFEVSIDNCDGEPILKPIDWKASLPSIVAGLQDFDPRLYLTCQFRLGKPVLGDRFIYSQQGGIIDAHAYPEMGFLTLLNSGAVLIESEAGAFDEAGGRYSELWRGVYYARHVSSYRPVLKPTAAPARERAYAGSRRFVDLIRNHGLVIASAAANQLPPAEMAQVIRDSLRQNKGAIVEALGEINANFAELGVLDQLSIAVSIHQAYDYVRYFEEKVAKFLASDERLNLGDRLIQERL